MYKTVVAIFLVFSVALFGAVPQTPSAPALDSADDTGSSNSDAITNKTTALTFTGTLKAGETIKIYKDSTTEIGSQTNNTTSNSTYSIDADFSEGSYSITATASNADGESGNSEVLYLNVDTTAAVSISTIKPVLVSDENGYEQKKLSISYDASSIEEGQNITLKVGGTNYTGSGGYSSIYATPSGVDGDTLSIEITASDVAGNSVSTSQDYTLDLIGNTQDDAQKISPNSSTDGVVFNKLNDDTEDYFRIELFEKSKLTLSIDNTNLKLQLLYLDGTSIVDGVTTTVQALESGSYYVRVYGDSLADDSSQSYTLSNQVVAYGSEKEGLFSANVQQVNTIGISQSGYGFVASGGMLYVPANYRAYNLQTGASKYYSFNGSYQSNDFVVIDGSMVFVDTNALKIVPKSNNEFTKTLTYTPVAIQQLEGKIYLLKSDGVVDVYDASDLSSLTLLTSYTYNDTSVKDFEIYKDSSGTLYFYMLNNVGVVTVTKLDGTSLGSVATYDGFVINSIAVEQSKGVMAVAGDGIIAIYDIDNVENPKLIAKQNSTYTNFIDLYGEYIIANIYGNANISKYGVDADELTSRYSYNYATMQDDKTYTINKAAGRADVDVFKIYPTYHEHITLTSSNVESSDLSITVYDQSGTEVVSATDFKNQSVDFDAYAQMYEIKISTSDILTSDNYQVAVSRSGRDDVMDNFYLLGLEGEDTYELGSTVSGDIADSTDVDIYRFTIATDGLVDVTGSDGVVAVLSTASKDLMSSPYVSFTPLNTNLLKAGTYYIKVTKSSATSYTLSSSFYPIDTTTEAQSSIRITNLRTNPDLQNKEITALDSSKGFVNISSLISNQTDKTQNYQGFIEPESTSSVRFLDILQAKNYKAQTNNTHYLFALYTTASSVGLDVIAYENNDKNSIVARKTILQSSSDTFEYHMVQSGDTLYISTPSGLYKADVSDIENITLTQNSNLTAINSMVLKSDTLYMATQSGIQTVTGGNIATPSNFNSGVYQQIALGNSYLFGLDGNKVEAIELSTKTKKGSKTIGEDIVNFAIMNDGLLAFSSQTKGLYLARYIEQSGIFETVLQSRVTKRSQEIITHNATIYLSDLVDYDTNPDLTQKTLVEVKIDKDFPTFFSDTKLFELDKNISGYISGANDKDSFKINLRYSGTLQSNIEQNTTAILCKIYDKEGVDTNKSCSGAYFGAGEYYVRLESQEQATKYVINISQTVQPNDLPDTVGFYKETTLAVDANATFSGTISNAEDVDNKKIYITSEGVVKLSGTDGITYNLLYSNGDKVEKNSNNEYTIKQNGFYFIEVTSQNVGDYSLDITFTKSSRGYYQDDVPKNITASAVLELGSYTTAKEILLGNMLYVADDSNGLSIIDATELQNMEVLSRTELQGTVNSLFVDGGIAYIANGELGFSVVDISNPTQPFSYGSFGSCNVNDVVANGKDVYVACDSGEILVYDFTTPSLPELAATVAATQPISLSIDQQNLYIADMQGGLKVMQLSSNRFVKTIGTIAPKQIEKDGDLLIAFDTTTNSLKFYDQKDYTLSTTIETNETNITGYTLQDKFLYLITDNSYVVYDYNKLDAVSSIAPTEVASLQDIAINANYILELTKNKINVRDSVTDYPDESDGVVLRYNTTTPKAIKGRFSKKSTTDSDLFGFVAPKYTGTLKVEVDAPLDTTIEYISEGDNATATNKLVHVINAKKFYIKITPKNQNDLFSYIVTYSFVGDAQADVLEDNVSIADVALGTVLDGDFYGGTSGDVDYFRFELDKREKIVFNTTSATKPKIELYYKDGSVIASNIKSGKLQESFDATLSKGEYFLRLSRFDTNTTKQNYAISTAVAPTNEIDVENGVSLDVIRDFYDVAYLDNNIYVLTNNKIIVYNRLLEKKSELDIGNIDLAKSDGNAYMFAHNQGGNLVTLQVAVIDYTNNQNNRYRKYTYDTIDLELNEDGQTDLSMLSDEQVLNITSDEYMVFYDEDAIGFKKVWDMYEISQYEQYSESNLNKAEFFNNTMYVASNDGYIDIVDISDKTNLKKLGTIENIFNVGAMAVDEKQDRLFVSSDNSVYVYDISQKDAPKELSSIEVKFSVNDLTYSGTPNSILYKNNKLYTTIPNVGVVVFALDTFNTLLLNDATLSNSILNLGQSLSDIYTQNEEIVNYVLNNELKVYFLVSDVASEGSSNSYTVVPKGSTGEGCFIATAAYGSYFEPHVKELRGFRDNVLRKFALGRGFIKLYYEYSPPIARYIAHNEVLKSIVRMLLLPFVFAIEYPMLMVIAILGILALRKRDAIFYNFTQQNRELV